MSKIISILTVLFPIIVLAGGGSGGTRPEKMFSFGINQGNSDLVKFLGESADGKILFNYKPVESNTISLEKANPLEISERYLEALKASGFTNKWIAIPADVGEASDLSYWQGR